MASKTKFVKDSLALPEVKEQMKQFVDFFHPPKTASKSKRGTDMAVQCAVCDMVMNAIQGWVAENISQQEIIQVLDDVCALVPPQFKIVCDMIADNIPSIVANFESIRTISIVCVDLGFCDKPFDNHDDPLELKTYVINLDLPPRQRWKEVCSVPEFVDGVQYLYKTLMTLIKGTVLEMVGDTLLYFFPYEYAEEIKGCAEALGIPSGFLALANLGYEVTDDCTSIVAQGPNGKIFHARNLDFGEGLGFTATLKQVAFISDFRQGGKTVFTGTSFAGYVGALSAMRPGAFSITIDTRFYPEGAYEIFYEIIAAIVEKNANLVAFLSRDCVQYKTSYADALKTLSSANLIADVYYIIAGTKQNEGAVISRNRENSSDIWTINYPNEWFLVQTNYDHWTEAPWYDDRIDPGVKGMKAIGMKNLTLDSMFSVLSTKPIFNLMTTYSILSCPADSIYKSYTRWCKFPCPL